MRNPLLDLYRGVCILFVILGHTAFLPDGLRNVIYSFHMPAFLILSGYLFNQNKVVIISDEIRLKFKRLVVPAWVMGLICGLPFIVLLILGKAGVSPTDFLQRFYGTITGYPSSSKTFISTPLWFLFTLFSIEVMAIIVRGFNYKLTPIVIFIIGCVGAYLSTLSLDVVPFNFFVSMTCCFFFAVGMFLKNANIKTTNIINISTIMIFCILAMCQYGGKMDLSQNIISSNNHILMNIIIALSGSYSVLLLCKLINNKKIIIALSWFGINTLPIIGFDYYANTISAYVFKLTPFSDAWFGIFILKIALLSSLLFILSKYIPKLNILIQGKST
ncbi:acyltransferase family protein [Photobacterium leiognathi]|uniref:acyltransferase family protein n=1 Tax=Photobacterium leiognathi TaxID=553611 RepID=UPI0029813373|nr:acyltransferase family protein [Photobacterium leiognathi]